MNNFYIQSLFWLTLNYFFVNLMNLPVQGFFWLIFRTVTGTIVMAIKKKRNKHVNMK